jgi:hypothetical protein
VTYAPVGTCTAGTCAYPARNTRCSNGCLNGACLAGSSLRETVPFTSASTSRTVHMILDASNQPHLAECRGGSIEYWRRTTAGWASINVDSQIGNVCDFSLAISDHGVVMIAYRVGSTPQLRLATLTAANSFSLDVVNLGASVAPSVAIDSSGAPVVAFVKTDVSPNQVHVARPGGIPWTSQQVFTVPSGTYTTPVAELLVGPDDRLHLLLGEGASSRTSYPAAVYATWSPSGWTVQNGVIINAYLSQQPMLLDESGDAIVFAQAYATPALWYMGATAIEYVYRFPENASPDREAVRTFSGWTPARAAKYWDHSFGSLTTAGAVTRRVARDYWVTAGSAKTATEVAVGSDGALRYLSYDGNAYAWYLVTDPCPKYCGGCGSDGCGGSCGECGQCDQCDPELRTCSGFRSERIPTYNFGPGMPVRRPDGSFMVGLSGPTLLGTTGAWTIGPAHSGALLPSPNGAHVYAIAINTSGGISRWNGSAFETVVYTTPTGATFSVDDAGVMHILRVDANQPAIVIYQKLEGTAMSAPETVYQYDSGTVYAGALIADQDGSIQAFFTTRLYDWMGGTTNSLHAVRAPGGGWTAEAFRPGGGVSSLGVDGAHTLYAISSECGQVFYSYKPLGQPWIKYTADCTYGGYSQIARSGPMLVAPDGQLMILASGALWEVDPATHNFAIVRYLPSQAGSAVYDQSGRLHAFGEDASSGIQHLRHYYEP